MGILRNSLPQQTLGAYADHDNNPYFNIRVASHHLPPFGNPRVSHQSMVSPSSRGCMSGFQRDPTEVLPLDFKGKTCTDLHSKFLNLGEG